MILRGDDDTVKLLVNTKIDCRIDFIRGGVAANSQLKGDWSLLGIAFEVRSFSSSTKRFSSLWSNVCTSCHCISIERIS